MWLTFRQVSLLGGTWLFRTQTPIALEKSYGTGEKKKKKLEAQNKDKIWEHFKINETSVCSQQTEVSKKHLPLYTSHFKAQKHANMVTGNRFVEPKDNVLKKLVNMFLPET